MQVPSNPKQKSEWLKFIVDACTASQPERTALYQKRRRYYLYGQNENAVVRFNRLKGHISLVASFLFSGDGLNYSISAPPNADDDLIQKFQTIEDDWNEEFRDSGLVDDCGDAILWALILDSMILKQGWNDREKCLFGELVEPSSIGIFNEATSKFESQRAIVHSYLLDYDDACERLRRAGKGDQIGRLPTMGAEGPDALPEVVTQLIISATGGSNLAGNIVGEINPEYESTPLYKPRLETPKVRFHESWIFDSDANDYRTLWMADPDIVLSDSAETLHALNKAAAEGNAAPPKYDSETNLFLKGEHPFTLFQPFPMYSYQWGEAHLEDLIPLQNWSNERLADINEILERQADPPKSFTGFMSIDEAKAQAWGSPGSWVFDQMPGAKAEPHPPEMPPDLFAEFAEIGNLMLEMSGLTEGIVGRGEKNVRGAGHHKELKITGGGRIRRCATGLEMPLSRVGTIGLRLMAKNSPEEIKAEGGQEFVMAQVLDDTKFTLRVDGHSHSPLFTMETRELAAMLFKAQAIDQEGLIRLLRPQQQQQLIHSLHRRQKAQAQARAQAIQSGAIDLAGKRRQPTK